MNSTKIVKRFIAGAVCPRCAKMDKLMMYADKDNQQVRECVRCGYKDVMTDNGPKQLNELKTRVNQPAPGAPTLAHEDEIQLVKIIDPGPDSKHRNR